MIYNCHDRDKENGPVKQEPLDLSPGEPTELFPDPKTYILTMDKSYTGSAGIFSRWTNQTEEAQVYSAPGKVA
eukprot:8557750-Pyramimonas_sp.AAC.1